MSETAWDVLMRITGSGRDVPPENAIRMLTARIRQLESVLTRALNEKHPWKTQARELLEVVSVGTMAGISGDD